MPENEQLWVIAAGAGGRDLSGQVLSVLRDTRAVRIPPKNYNEQCRDLGKNLLLIIEAKNGQIYIGCSMSESEKQQDLPLGHEAYLVCGKTSL
jgi:hypothetical protein